MAYATDPRIQEGSKVQVIYPEHAVLHQLKTRVLEIITMPGVGVVAELDTKGERGFAFNVTLPLRFLRLLP